VEAFGAFVGRKEKQQLHEKKTYIGWCAVEQRLRQVPHLARETHLGEFNPSPSLEGNAPAHDELAPSDFLQRHAPE
jgi:hypothetical protein